MRFQSIALWNRRNGDYVNICEWHAPNGKFPTGKSVKLSLPLDGCEPPELEIRARIWADGCMEMSGRQGMLLSRLMDEFPPPEEADG